MLTFTYRVRSTPLGSPLLRGFSSGRGSVLMVGFGQGRPWAWANRHRNGAAGGSTGFMYQIGRSVGRTERGPQ